MGVEDLYPNPNFSPASANTTEAIAFTADATRGASLLFDDAFSGELSRRYNAAKDARADIEKQMLADLRRRDGQYEPDVLARLESQGGSTVFDNVTDLKCSGIESMLAEILFMSGDSTWALEPTEQPELDEMAEQEAVRAVVERAMGEGVDPAQMPPEAFAEATAAVSAKIKEAIVSEAKKRADGMESLIRDQLQEGGFEEAMNAFISDFATFPVAAIMGPCPQTKIVSVVRGGELDWEERLVLSAERISPLDIYPESMSTKPGDGDFFVRRRITQDQAFALKGIPGVLADRLAVALAGKTSDETRDTEQMVIAQGSATGSIKPDPEHELVYWWHWMSRSEASAFTGQQAAEDALADERVPMTGLMLNGIVIKAVENLDKTGAPNVFVASFRNRPGSFWGYGGADLAKGQQEQVNVVARALTNNIHRSSTPSYQVDQNALVQPQAMAKTYPGQVIYTRQTPGDTRTPVNLLATPNYTLQLIEARNHAVTWLDEKTGVYPQSYGNPAQTGPAETLGGYQLLRQDQTKTMKRALLNVSQAIAGLIKAYWRWNMVFSDDASIKGDFNVVTRGAMQLYLTSEDADQMLAVLQLVERSQMLQSIMRPEGIAHLFREILRMRRIDPDKILLTDAEIKQANAQAAEQAQAAPPMPERARPDSEAARMRAQADLIRANAQADRVKLEAEKVSISRADVVAKVRKAQEEIARSRMDRMAVAAPAPAMPDQQPQIEPQPAMGAEA